TLVPLCVGEVVADYVGSAPVAGLQPVRRVLSGVDAGERVGRHFVRAHGEPNALRKVAHAVLLPRRSATTASIVALGSRQCWCLAGLSSPARASQSRSVLGGTSRRSAADWTVSVSSHAATAASTSARSAHGRARRPYQHRRTSAPCHARILASCSGL